jgi:hypothetical protein
MKKTTCLFLFLIGTCFFHTKAQNYLTLEKCKELYLQERYSEIVPSLNSFQGSGYEKNSYLINYMLGTSLCRAGKNDDGRKILSWILVSYDLNSDQKRFINQKLNNCQNTAIAYRVTLPNDLAYSRNSNAGVHSKLFLPSYVADSNYWVSSTASMFIDSLYFHEYPKRILSLHTIPGKAEIIALHPNLNKVMISKHFIVSGDNLTSENLLSRVSGNLERVIEFYRDYYELELPDHYIHVFIVSSYSKLGEFAKDYHHIRVERHTIGYTFEMDASILGYIPPTSSGSTLYHELLHLLMHQDFQAIPPWMDEGLASLYEVAEFDRSGFLKGLDNWRGEIIRRNMEYINYKYREFDQIMTSFNWQHANEWDFLVVIAMSRYFFLYLQEKGYLKEYILSVKDYGPAQKQSYYVDKLIEITKNPEIINDFRFWLSQRLGIWG